MTCETRKWGRNRTSVDLLGHLVLPVLPPWAWRLPRTVSPLSVCRTRACRRVHFSQRLLRVTKYATPALFCEYKCLAPTESYAVPAPVVKYISPTPAVNYAVRGASSVCLTRSCGRVHLSSGSGKLRPASSGRAVFFSSSCSICRASSCGGVQSSRGSCKLRRTCTCRGLLFSSSCSVCRASSYGDVHLSGASGEPRLTCSTAARSASAPRCIQLLGPCVCL